jgi:aryl-alcohol dehydrogenase-like predicted oxidoreductase
MPGEAESEPADDEQDGVRDADPRRERAQERDRDEEADDDGFDVLHTLRPGGMLDPRPLRVNAMAPRSPLPAGPAIGAAAHRIGLAALGRPGYLNVGHGADLGSDRSVAPCGRAVEVLDAAYAAGVRYFDTARSYGRGEEFLGAWLRDRDPEGVVVGSKWGYVYRPSGRSTPIRRRSSTTTPATFRRQLEETRAKPRRGLALYQIHSATPDSGVLENDEVLEELAALRATGVAIGLTTSGTSQAQTLDARLELDLFDTAQVTWNLTSARPAPRSRARTTPGWARSSRRRWRTGAWRRGARTQPSTASPTGSAPRRRGRAGGGAGAAVRRHRAQRRGDDGSAALEPGGGDGRARRRCARGARRARGAKRRLLGGAQPPQLT